MLIPAGMEIHLAMEPVSLIKSIDGLCAEVERWVGELAPIHAARAPVVEGLSRAGRQAGMAGDQRDSRHFKTAPPTKARDPLRT